MVKEGEVKEKGEEGAKAERVGRSLTEFTSNEEREVVEKRERGGNRGDLRWSVCCR